MEQLEFKKRAARQPLFLSPTIRLEMIRRSSSFSSAKENGFTLVELIVTIVLVGILLGTAIPTFYRTINETQEQVNISNMGIIKDTFMQYMIMLMVSLFLVQLP